MAVPPSSRTGSGRSAARRAGIGDQGPASTRGVAEILVLPAPVRRRGARTALARVLTRLRTEAAAKAVPPTLPSPRSSLEIHGRSSHVRLPDDVA